MFVRDALAGGTVATRAVGPINSRAAAAWAPWADNRTKEPMQKRSAMRVSFVIAVPAMVSLRCNVLNANSIQLSRAIDSYAPSMTMTMTVPRVVVVVVVRVIAVRVIARIAPPRIVVGVWVGVAIIAVVAGDDLHRTISDGGEHMISNSLAHAGLLEAIDIVGRQDVNDRGGSEIFENGAFTDLVATKFFDIGNGQDFAIEHSLFEDRRDGAVLDFLAGILAVGREKGRTLGAEGFLNRRLFP
jgi:hypothetical protein